MSKNQEKLMRFIDSYRKENLQSPTYKEMLGVVKVYDTKSISIIVHTLIKKGFLVKSRKHTSRAITLTDKARTKLGFNVMLQDYSLYPSTSAGGTR